MEMSVRSNALSSRQLNVLELCAVIVHRGRVITSGHYYVYIKKTVEIETVVTESDGESRTEKKIFRWYGRCMI